MASLTSVWFNAWQGRLRRASHTSLRNKTVLTAFNAVVDKIILYDVRKFHSFFAHFQAEHRSILRKSKNQLARVDSPQALISTFIHAFKTGKAIHVPSNNELLEFLAKNYSTSTSLGGQAGIIANQFALLGAMPILYAPQLSPQLANLFSPRVKFPVCNKNSLSFNSVRHSVNADKAKTNFIIEYKKGDVFKFAGSIYVAPRSNRIILSSSSTAAPLFSTNLVHVLPELGEAIDAAIISGYHSLQPKYEDGTTFEYYLALEELYLKMLKSHKNVPIHIEYVSTPFNEIDKAIYTHITKYVDSLGLNEIETIELAEKLCFAKEARDIVKNENAVTLHAAGAKIMQALKLRRLHIHNLGYHLILLKKPVDGHKIAHQVNAALYGSLAATSRALNGKEIARGDLETALQIGVSEITLHQMTRFAAHQSLSRHRAEHALLTGTFDVGDHVLLIVPGQVSPIIRRTVGLGDVVSSCSFLAGL